MLLFNIPDLPTIHLHSPILVCTTLILNPVQAGNVNYLNSTIDPNEDELSSRMNVIDEMQNDPDYWVDFLKQIVTGE